MNLPFAKPKCGCVIEQSFRDFIRHSAANRSLLISYYRFRVARPANTNASAVLTNKQQTLFRLLFSRFTSFIEQTNRPLRLKPASFLWHADSLFLTRFKSRRFHGRQTR